MEKIEKELEDIVLEKLKKLKEKKEVPSKEVLDTINTLVHIKNCY